MTTGHVFIATSLDGFVARVDGCLDWLMKQKTDGEDHGYDAFMASVDGLIMGRGSYENVLSFDGWPNEKPVVVLSKTLKHDHIPKKLKDRVEVTDAEPRQLMEHLDRRDWQRAYIDGAKVVQSFLAEGLIEDIVVTRVPILIRNGRSLFGPLAQDIDLIHLETRSYSSALVTSKYRISS